MARLYQYTVTIQTDAIAMSIGVEAESKSAAEAQGKACADELGYSSPTITVVAKPLDPDTHRDPEGERLLAEQEAVEAEAARVRAEVIAAEVKRQVDAALAQLK